MTSDRFLFMHVPKTGGTSLSALIESHYADDEIIPRHLLGHDWIATDRVREDLERVDRFTLLRGHYNTDVCELVGDGRFRFAVIRDPVQRVLSLWEDWRTKSDENLAEATPEAREMILFARSNSLEDLLRSDMWLMKRYFHDAQTDQFSGWHGDVDEDSFHRALQNVASFDLLGRTERMDDTVRALCGAMGWQPPANTPRLNARRDDTSVDPALAETILEFNRFDARFYQIASAWSDRQLDAEPRSPSASRSTTARGPLAISMGSTPPGSGWHELEGMGGPKTWRWTGPGRASTVDLDLAPHTEFSLEIRVISVIDQEILDGAQLFLDGVPHSWEHAGVDDGEQVMRAKIEPSHQRRSRLTISVPRTMSHAEVQPETGDDRQKGLAVTRIGVSSAIDSGTLPDVVPVGRKVIHHHIMKTGGTTVNAMLDAKFRQDRVMPADIGPRYRKQHQQSHGAETPFHFWSFAPLGQLFDEYDLIHDHKNFLLFVPREFFALAVFRDPIARVRSLVRDWRRLSDAALAQDPEPIRKLKLAARTKNTAEISRIADHPVTRAWLHNGMAKSLLLDLFPNAQLNAMPDEQLLWHAARRFDRLDFVGLSERLDSTIAMLFARLGVAPPREIPRLNATKPRPADEPEASETQELEDLNRVDRTIFEMATTRFEQQLAETDPSVLQPITEASSSSHAESKPTSDSVAETSSTL